MGDDLIPPSAATLTYRGTRGRTRRVPWHIGCECGLSFVAEVHEAIDLADAEAAGAALLSDEIDRARCPHCGRSHVPELARTVHDPRRPLFVLWLPPSLRSRELELRAELLLGLAADPSPVPEYVKSFRLVFGVAALHAVLGAAAAPVAAPLPADDARAALRRARGELRRARRDLEVDRVALQALAVDLSLRRQSGPGRGDGRGDEATAVLQPLVARRPPATQPGWGHDGRALVAGVQHGQVVLALRPGPVLPRLQGAAPRVLVQLDSAATPPRLSLAVVPSAVGEGSAGGRGRAAVAAKPLAPAVEGGGRSPVAAEAAGAGGVAAAVPRAETGRAGDGARGDRPGEDRPAGERSGGADTDACFLWHCDAKDPASSAVFERLAQDFALDLDLYDDALEPVARWQLWAPLAENAAEALRRARFGLVAGPTPGGGVAAPLPSCADSGAGCTQGRLHDLSAEAFAELPSPAVARLALRLMEYWAEAPHEERLLWRESFPLRRWDELRSRVLSGALAFGLLPSEALLAYARARGLWAETPERLRGLLARFARISRRQEPSDLDPLAEWENWQALFLACEQVGLPVEPGLRQLAGESARRVQERSDALDARAAADGALVILSTQELRPLVSSVETRRDGALELDEQDIVDQEELLGDADIVDTRWLEDRTPAVPPIGLAPMVAAAATPAPQQTTAAAEGSTDAPVAAAALPPILDVGDDDIVERAPVSGDAPAQPPASETQ